MNVTDWMQELQARRAALKAAAEALGDLPVPDAPTSAAEAEVLIGLLRQGSLPLIGAARHEALEQAADKLAGRPASLAWHAANSCREALKAAPDLLAAAAEAGDAGLLLVGDPPRFAFTLISREREQYGAALMLAVADLPAGHPLRQLGDDAYVWLPARGRCVALDATRCAIRGTWDRPHLWYEFHEVRRATESWRLILDGEARQRERERLAREKAAADAEPVEMKLARRIEALEMQLAAKGGAG